MAKKPSRKRGLTAIPFSESKALSTLADDTVISGNLLSGNLTEDFFCTSIVGTVSLEAHTAGEGPIEMGIAHNDYTVAEILENLKAEILGTADKILLEQSRRLVRRGGMFTGQATSEVLNQGMPIKIIVKRLFESGKTINLWARNMDTAGGPLTTGTLLNFHGTVFGRWVR